MLRRAGIDIADTDRALRFRRLVFDVEIFFVRIQAKNLSVAGVEGLRCWRAEGKSSRQNRVRIVPHVDEESLKNPFGRRLRDIQDLPHLHQRRRQERATHFEI